MSHPTSLLVAFLTGLAGAAAGVALAQVVLPDPASRAVSTPLPTGIDALSSELASLETALEARLGREQQLEGELALLADRLRRLETEGGREPVVPAAPPPMKDPALEPAAGTTEGKEELSTLLAKVLGSETATSEEQQRFWELVRTSGLLGELLAELEGTVARDPLDVAARLELADAYVAKLLSVPMGPERGIWGEKAEEQWKEAARIEPDSWEAHFALGENYSYYPSFLNKGGEALEYLERARELQERGAARPEHVPTYVLLARVYQQQGDPDRARAALHDGLAAHPGNPQLLEALAQLGE